MINKPKKTRFIRGAAMMHEDVVTPMHHHNENDDELIVKVGDRAVAMSCCEADGFVTERFDRPELYEVEHAHGGPRRIKRRHVLGGVAAGFGALLAGSALPRYSFADPGTTDGSLLVCVFLRGGFDGLSAVAPLGDAAYLDARPTIGVRPEQAIALDDMWGLNQNMSSLQEAWQAGELAIVQGSGSPDVTRSHFQDQATVERAAPANVRSGWLGRHLQTSASSTGTFRGITVGNSTVMSLSADAVNALAVSSISAFDLRTYASEEIQTSVRHIIQDMYGSAGGAVQGQADITFDAVDTLRNLRGAGTTAQQAAGYPDNRWGQGLAEIAQLAHSGVGIEVACIDLGGWDMHQQVGSAGDAEASFSRLSRELAEGLAAFRRDMGDRWAKTTVVTMSEFGRRVAENGSAGLDHGQGNTMFVMGGGINGGKVYGTVPTLTEDNLSLGDVPITLDYRQALSEIVAQRLGNGDKLAEVFPGFTPGGSLGIV